MNNFTKPTLITITAPTCSGKTYLLEHLKALGFSRIIGITTREPREGEAEGVDYYFISKEKAAQMEANNEFAETAEFRGQRYGVTHAEMATKMHAGIAPVVILEPQGLASYEKYCKERDYDIFKVYVTVPEKLKLERLNTRTVLDIQAVHENFKKKHLDWSGTMVDFPVSSKPDAEAIAKIIKTHTDRLLSITGDERLWQTQNTWDAIVPGDDINKAIAMIEQGTTWRNSQNAQANT